MKRQKYTMVPKHQMLFRVYKLCSFLVLLVLIILPIAPVFAGEEIFEENTQSSEVFPEVSVDIPEEQNETSSDLESENGATETDIPQEVITTEVTDFLPDAESTESTNELTHTTNEPVITDAVQQTGHEEAIIEQESSDTPLDIISIETETVDTAGVISEATTTASATPTPPQQGVFDTATETSEVVTPHEEEVAEVVSSTTQETMTEISEYASTSQTDEQQNIIFEAVPTSNGSQLVFTKSQCTITGSGVYYCVNATNTPEVLHTDRVFSAPDENGDKDIYIESNSELHKITDNMYDDESPYYDEMSDTLVWHRLVDGVNQIVSYVIETKNETILSSPEFNSMEPKRYGETTVWQGWVGDDWEIFMQTSEAPALQLTDNFTQDIGPSIHENHVVWQSFEDGTWWVKVYDLNTQKTETIDASDGASILNPRFVLVYDTKYDNGDVETRGYNLEDGTVVHLGSTPAPVPAEIPEPEQTGEKSALVNPSNQIKSKTDEVEDDAGTSTPPLLTDDLDNSDLVIPPFIATTTNSQQGTVNDSFNESITTEKVSPVAHIEDIVIPTLSAPSNETSSSSKVETDSQ